MRRFGGWLVGSGPPEDLLSKFDEVTALREAMEGAAMVMNDDYVEAEAELSKGDTPFHKLGLGCVYFLRSLLGMEKETIANAVRILADSEESALEHQKAAIRDPKASHQSKIYPPGAEYALAHAESQLMYAVCAILNASLTESLRGLYKLRKAYQTLLEISKAEKKYLKSLDTSNGSIKSSTAPASIRSGIAKTPSIASYRRAPAAVNGGVAKPVGVDEDEDEFFDAADDASTPSTQQRSQTDVSSVSLTNGIEALKINGSDPTGEDFDFTTVTSDPVDIFIHSGLGLAFGTFQLVLSMVPPPYDKMLAFLSFKGDRKRGLDMLWSSTRFIENVNGALSSLISLVFYTGPIAFCEIRPAGSLPRDRLHDLLHRCRTLYPRSKLWKFEEAVLLSGERNSVGAIAALDGDLTSPMPSISAVCEFAKGLHLLYAHDYEGCASCFMQLFSYSDWSHGTYYYIAGVCYVDMYRLAKNTDSAKADEYKAKANEYLGNVLPNLGKKKVLGQGLPVEEFVKRKMNKFNARAAARNVDLVDAFGVSPSEDIIYFWGGYPALTDEQLRTSIERLDWVQQFDSWADEPADEKTVHSMLKALCLRCLGETEKAKTEFETGVLSYSLSTLKTSSRDPDLWALPLAHFELAILYWNEAGGEHGDRALLEQCAQHVKKIAHWGTFELESAHGIRISAAVDTLKNVGLQV